LRFCKKNTFLTLKLYVYQDSSHKDQYLPINFVLKVMVFLKRIKIVFGQNKDLLRSVPKVEKYEIACQLWILIVFSLRMGISCRLLTFALHLITVITWLKNLPGCPIVSPFPSHPALFLPASFPFSISITPKQWTHMWVFVFWLSWNRVKTQMLNIFHMPMLETEKKIRFHRAFRCISPLFLPLPSDFDNSPAGEWDGKSVRGGTQKYKKGPFKNYS